MKHSTIHDCRIIDLRKIHDVNRHVMKHAIMSVVLHNSNEISVY